MRAQWMVVSLMLLSWVPGAAAQPMVSFTAGHVGVADDLDKPQWYGVEFHRGDAITRWNLVPGAGVARAACGATFVHVNVRKTFWLSRHWGVIKHFGPGYYAECDEIRLGHELQFRSGLELVYRTPRDAQFALGITHLSNAGIGRLNPGTETIALSFSMPL